MPDVGEHYREIARARPWACRHGDSSGQCRIAGDDHFSLRVRRHPRRRLRRCRQTARRAVRWWQSPVSAVPSGNADGCHGQSRNSSDLGRQIIGDRPGRRGTGYLCSGRYEQGDPGRRAAAAQAADQLRLYSIAKGDTLVSIAKKYYHFATKTNLDKITVAANPKVLKDAKTAAGGRQEVGAAGHRSGWQAKDPDRGLLHGRDRRRRQGGGNSQTDGASPDQDLYGGAGRQPGEDRGQDAGEFIETSAAENRGVEWFEESRCHSSGTSLENPGVNGGFT